MKKGEGKRRKFHEEGFFFRRRRRKIVVDGMDGWTVADLDSEVWAQSYTFVQTLSPRVEVKVQARL